MCTQLQVKIAVWIGPVGLPHAFVMRVSRPGCGKGALIGQAERISQKGPGARAVIRCYHQHRATKIYIITLWMSLQFAVLVGWAMRGVSDRLGNWRWRVPGWWRWLVYACAKQSHGNLMLTLISIPMPMPRPMPIRRLAGWLAGWQSVVYFSIAMYICLHKRHGH